MNINPLWICRVCGLAALLISSPTLFAESMSDCLYRFDKTLEDFNSDVSPDGQTLVCLKSGNELRLELTGNQTCSAFHQTIYIQLTGKSKSCEVSRFVLQHSCGSPYEHLGTNYIKPNKEYSQLVKTIKSICANGL